MKKIICAPNGFKECLTAAEVAQAMAAGVLRADPHITCDTCPVGDGGQGTLDALVAAMGGAMHTATVTGPLGGPVEARYAMLVDGGLGVVELAEAAGLHLVPSNQRDPTRTTTFGVGQLIRLAANAGCREIIVCIGGSATVDGGAGMAQALGVRFIDRAGNHITELLCGERLQDILRIDAASMQRLPPVRVACDVTNPLCGPEGAAAVYGPQKGATPQQVRDLDDGLRHLADIVKMGTGSISQKTGTGSNLLDIPSAGAAGGAGFGLLAFCGATLKRGIDLVLDALRFDERLRDVDLVLTGEGRLDAQSLHGKACIGVATRAAKFGVPTIAIVGSTGPGADDCVNPSRGGMLKRFVSLKDRYGVARALGEATTLIEHCAEEITRMPRNTSA